MRVLKYGILLLAITVLHEPLLNAQAGRSVAFTNYSNKEGFDQNTVFAIEQDTYGMFWLGTSNGLIKYDGFTFYNTSWEPENQADIYHGRIVDILSDEKGLLWILSVNGLNIYNPSLERFIKITSDSMSNLTGLREDPEGAVWVFGNGYLSSVTAEVGTKTIITEWTPNLIPAELAGLVIHDLLKINDDLYLMATSGGVYKMMFSGNTKRPDFELETLIPEVITNRIIRQNDIIWIGTQRGLYKTVVEGKNLRFLERYINDADNPASISGNNIRELLIGPDQGLWIGTWGGGLSRYDRENETFTNFLFDARKKEGISSPLINCIYKDQFNVLWIGTAQGGLSKLDLARKQFTNIEHNPYDDQSIPGNLINSIIEDSEGYLWISAFRSPLCRSTLPVNENNISNLTFERFQDWFNTFTAKNILSIYEDKYGLLWLGYEDAVVVYDRFKDTFTEIILYPVGRDQPVNLSNVNYISAIDEDRIMIACNFILILNDPWSYIKSGKQSRVPVYAQLFNDNNGIITAEIEGPDNFWIGYANEGLSQYALSGDSLVLERAYEFREEDGNSISNNAVFSIHKDSDHSLWIGTFGGGLNRMVEEHGGREGVFDRLLDTLDLHDNALYGIIEENDSILWLSTDLGICKLNKRTLETIRFNMTDGIASNNFRKNAHFKGHSGYYYFGGLNGLTVFKPDQIQPNLIPPEIKLSTLKINNKKVAPGDQVNKKFILEKPVSEIPRLVLTRDDRTLSIDVIVMQTSTPEKNSFSYMLEGFDVDWIHVNQGSFTLNYTNLPQGKYTLRILGFNGDGVPSENETSLPVIMLAPWYAQLWSKFLFALIGLSVFLGISMYIIKLKSLENSLHYEKIDKERITEINMAKLRFFTNVSHEFRTPLALISIPLQKLQELVSDNEQKKYLGAIEKNANKLIRLIDQLLTFRRIEHGKLELKLSKTSMDGFLFPIAEAFEALSVKKEIEFIYRVKEPELNFNIDLEKMEQVLFNLLSNAFKFTPPGGRITLEGKSCMIDGRHYVCFEVRDTGKGIHRKDIDKIFERFYQSDSELKNMGTGIGLSYSKSIIELHSGYIHVDSTPGTGTLFSVTVPFIEGHTFETDEVEIKRLDPNEMIEFEELAAGMGTVLQEINNSEGTILIVDDEEDFRMAIKDIFKKNFRILEASNGKEALELTREKDPDLIISDVMMPLMNGYDFCKYVKTDIDLCHIPFILLTALEEMDNHIQGVEYGADSYITKPFNLKYLEVTVHKMIENKRKIQEHFSRSHSLPKNIKISGIDREFIERVNETIGQNMENSSFGVEELAEKINLSTSQLYRKLKLLTGQIPNAYIRNFRLQTAADLLSNNPGISVKSVMYEVGIESASHFSSAFKKKFGLSPSEFNE